MEQLAIQEILGFLIKYYGGQKGGQQKLAHVLAVEAQQIYNMRKGLQKVRPALARRSRALFERYFVWVEATAEKLDIYAYNEYKLWWCPGDTKPYWNDHAEWQYDEVAASPADFDYESSEPETLCGLWVMYPFSEEEVNFILSQRPGR